MYYRITTFTYDPARESEVLAQADSVRDGMNSIDGLQSGCAVRVAEGKCISVGIYDSAESAAAAQSKVQELWNGMAPLMTSPPELQEGPTIWEL